jgi:hypothetical protein
MRVIWLSSEWKMRILNWFFWFQFSVDELIIWKSTCSWAIIIMMGLVKNGLFIGTQFQTIVKIFHWSKPWIPQKFYPNHSRPLHLRHWIILNLNMMAFIAPILSAHSHLLNLNLITLQWTTQNTQYCIHFYWENIWKNWTIKNATKKASEIYVAGIIDKFRTVDFFVANRSMFHDLIKKFD